jgi:hypothetical protein
MSEQDQAAHIAVSFWKTLSASDSGHWAWPGLVYKLPQNVWRAQYRYTQKTDKLRPAISGTMGMEESSANSPVDEPSRQGLSFDLDVDICVIGGGLPA